MDPWDSNSDSCDWGDSEKSSLSSDEDEEEIDDVIDNTE